LLNLIEESNENTRNLLKYNYPMKNEEEKKNNYISTYQEMTKNKNEIIKEEIENNKEKFCNKYNTSKDFIEKCPNINEHLELILKENNLELLIDFISNVSFNKLLQIKDFLLERTLNILCDFSNNFCKDNYNIILNYIKKLVLGVRIEPSVNLINKIKEYLKNIDNYYNKYINILNENEKNDINFLISYLK
jgi:hypothetical protein